MTKRLAPSIFKVNEFDNRGRNRQKEEKETKYLKGEKGSQPVSFTTP